MSQHSNQTDAFLGCLLGLAIGDAVGTTVEFSPRGTFEPLTDMVGGGPFKLNAGEWTDDTSMALCLAHSLIEQNGFDAADQMQRYCNWRNDGYMSSNGVCFDIGNTVSAALNRFQASGDPFSGSTDPYAAGNGSIMRLAPIPMFYFPDESLILHYAAESSKTTHAAEECLDACKLMGGMLYVALSGQKKDDMLSYTGYIPTTSKIQAIAQGEYRQKSRADIQGNGYVVTALEAALWCFTHTDNFKDAILMAANLGDDADTTAAICGQFAGAYYGKSGIPTTWLNRLTMRQHIEEIAIQLMQ